MKKYNLSTKLISLLNQHNLTEKDLSIKTGIPTPTICRMIKQKSNPTLNTLKPIANYFNISISELVGDEIANNGYRHIPIISWEMVHAWIDLKESNNSNNLNWLFTQIEVSNDTFAVDIKNNSFGPILRKNSIIIVDPSVALENGQLVVLNHKNNLLIKKLLIDGSDRYLKTINPEIKKTEPLTKDFNLIGVIVEIRYSINSI